MQSERDFRDLARSQLRQWLSSADSEVLGSVDGLGARAIREASEASIRLNRSVAASASAEQSLRNLQALATSLEAPPKRSARSFFGRSQAVEEPGRSPIEDLVESLDRERDEVARSLITIETDSGKLHAAATTLHDALMLIRACAAAVDAAARELMFDQPERARFLSETVAARLLTREQDILTQATVTQQGILALQLLLDGQNALALALNRARDTSVAALRTAIAARRVVAGSHDMAQQADAIERSASARERPTPSSGSDLRHVLDEAVDEARRAIPTQGTIPPPGTTPRDTPS